MKEQVDIARDYLLENIVMHRILPGTVLFETIIAEKLSMSRTPVRQALNDAVAIGLLTHTKGKRGYLLPELSCKEEYPKIFVTKILSIFSSFENSSNSNAGTFKNP